MSSGSALYQFELVYTEIGCGPFHCIFSLLVPSRSASPDNLTGLGFGPLYVGVLSNQLAANDVDSPLGTSMLIFGVLAAIGASAMYGLAAFLQCRSWPPH
jgi:hypothetical protein